MSRLMILTIMSTLAAACAFQHMNVAQRTSMPTLHSQRVWRGKALSMSFDPSGGPSRPTRKAEEEQDFFQTTQDKMTTAERFQDPLVLLGLGGIFFPFILLGVAYANGWVGN
uniref:Uncharacterized protein n=1 Tax=Octactis speculum TaxID=3111310 RepID=A0A7S2MD77_9STRA|mmetsp:Transcript_59965/g.82076  ORF Transcript_59965/g.82076 Transcript_59965/m.82076 type:complete len:112 (+) Transcript_59965:32-367(+)|eukprot:CAMPEP_0185766556 /NCGR_PEP_ID=MMETSP1174-20130828/38435_1 /TAXON_ID=35687 /ORGANISM="Dictyocha speculum, Strain CCMP1381" /LENGTH=111 /DNA_ID=CAMNT_0028450307 /DNA_START=22 /DNA_END=357 /DNA_ORIENTATION=-